MKVDRKLEEKVKEKIKAKSHNNELKKIAPVRDQIKSSTPYMCVLSLYTYTFLVLIDEN